MRPGSADDGPIVVIGAGVVGVCCALQLRREGHEVILLDPHGPGGHASSSNAGIFTTNAVVPLATSAMLRRAPAMFADPSSPLGIPYRYGLPILPWFARFALNARTSRVEHVSRTLAELTAESLAAYEPLVEASGAHDLFSDAGVLYAYRSERAFEEVQPALRLRHRRGVVFDVLDRQDIVELEPELERALHAVRYPRSRRTTDPGALVRRFADHFEGLGGHHVADEAMGFRFEGTRLRAVVGKRHEYPCGRAVIAAGAWSKRLSSSLGDRLPLDTERGYLIEVPDAGVSLSHAVIYEDRHIAVSPMRGALRLAGMSEFGGLRTPPNARRATRISSGIRELLPGLSTVGARWWMSYRPSMPDSLPVVGRSTRSASVLYAFGHGHVGLEFGALTGRLVADLVATRESGIDLASLAPTRFTRAPGWFGRRGSGLPGAGIPAISRRPLH